MSPKLKLELAKIGLAMQYARVVERQKAAAARRQAMKEPAVVEDTLAMAARKQGHRTKEGGIDRGALKAIWKRTLADALTPWEGALA